METQKDYQDAVQAAKIAWEREQEARTMCMNGLASESEVDEARRKAENASEYTQHVYKNQDQNK